MLDSRQDLLQDKPSKPFSGVRFVLLGFDYINKDKFRLKLLEGGGIDAVNYGPDCTHVIVDKLIYDDPICVAARRDGKILVTALWVDHSFDVGIPVDPSSVMYWPQRDLSGIPGAKSLIVCLTGYQRQDRDDIMTMVSLMGANFSKPLVANKVTHLICYKFEADWIYLVDKLKFKTCTFGVYDFQVTGEKYQLAKKMRKIKLVNHRWLEDCLRAWELLPEDEYDKSGYELDMKEAEAKDSEEEIEDMAKVKDSERRVTSAQSTQTEVKASYQPLVKQEILGNNLNLSSSRSLTNIANSNEVISPLGNKISVDKETHKHVEMLGSLGSRSPGKMSSDILLGSRSLRNVDSDLPSSSRSVKGSPNPNVSKLSEKNYSRKTPKKPSLPLCSEGIGSNAGNTSTSKADDLNVSGGSKISYLGSHPDAADFGRAETPTKTPALHLNWEHTTRSTGKRKILLGSSESLKMSHDPKVIVGRESSKRTDFDNVETPSKRPALQLDWKQTTASPGRRKMTIFHGSSESAKMSCDPKIGECESSEKRTEGLVAESLVGNSHALAGHSSPTYFLGEGAGLEPRPECREEPLQSSCKGLELRGSSCNLDANYLYLSGKKSSTSEVEMPQSNLQNLGHSYSGDDVSQVEKINGRVDVDLPKEGHAGSLSKSLGRKMLGGKKLGSRSGISKGNAKRPQGSTSLQKVVSSDDSMRYSIELLAKEGNENVASAQKSEMACADKDLPVGDETEAPEDNDELKMDVADNKQNYTGIEALQSENMLADNDIAKQADENIKDVRKKDAKYGANEDSSEVKKAICSKKNELCKSKSIKDARKRKGKQKSCGDEAPQSENMYSDRRIDVYDIANQAHDNVKDANSWANEDDTEAEKAVCSKKNELSKSNPGKDARVGKVKQKSIGPEATQPRNMCADRREDAYDIAKQADDNVKDAASGVNEDDTEAKKAVCGKKNQLCKSKSVKDAKVRKVTKGKKHSSTKTKTKTIEKLGSPWEGAQENESNTKNDEEETDKTKKRPSKKLKRSIISEKENALVTVGGRSVSLDEKAAGKLTLESSEKLSKSSTKVAESGSVKGVEIEKVNGEPACFILSGHKLQRKDFQQVIRRLKGRVCRDSHHWSYQATHFVVPDPIRRTEKFFAAAASGSWILKTDYLRASNETGTFLAEEPYEWHKKCLSEDGAINLEAPRKWRLLRERTGHGAFYGMRIIIYGECIAPPLDTLKRVVKAGDGTILATSPPYTRLLQSRIDFAVVSAGMPRVDMWVQEFLRHEIPCVVADYLVEYVCKPGYSLERHVQYNTHAWAEKSFKKLVNRVDEVIEEMRTLEDDKIDNLACVVCGSRDRGDEMLICGNDSGSAGCGIGTHIDCCDPPLEDVPEEDWFCPECLKKSGSRSDRKSPRKGASKSGK